MLSYGLRTLHIFGETVRSSFRRTFQVRLHSGAPISSATAPKYAGLRLLSGQQGDTIVEVFIAIVVVSVILVAAYTTTTHNVNAMQDTQEHSEALQLAQTQLEFLHNADATQQAGVVGKCFDTGGNITGGAGCKVDASGSPTASQPQFTLKFAKSSSSFSIIVKWSSLDNLGVTNNVTLFYQP